MLNCIAIDDEPMALEIIKSFCKNVPFLKLSRCFTQVSLARKYLQKFPVDLIFLDIQMPDINGIEFYKSLKQEAMVIFTTAFSEYAVEGFNVNAIDYLLKPIEFERFQAACKKVQDYSDYLKSSKSISQNCIYVRSEYALVKISYSDILYLETMDDYIRIHRIDKEPILTLMSMSKMLEKLPKREFVRVHRSYIVPLSKITSVRGKTIKVGGINIPIGTSYKSKFLNTYSPD